MKAESERNDANNRRDRVKVRCRCGDRYRVPDHLAGRIIRCRSCGEDLLVPRGPEPERPPRRPSARGAPALARGTAPAVRVSRPAPDPAGGDAGAATGAPRWPLLAGLAGVALAIGAAIVVARPRPQDEIAPSAVAATTPAPVATPDVGQEPADLAALAVAEADGLETRGHPDEALARLESFLADCKDRRLASLVAVARDRLVAKLRAETARARAAVERAPEEARLERGPEPASTEPASAKAAEVDTSPEPAPPLERTAPPAGPAKPPAEAAAPPPEDGPRAPREGGEDAALALRALEARALINRRDLTKADALVAALEKEAPGSPAVQCARALVDFERGLFTTCESGLVAALGANPDDAWVKRDLALCRFYHGRYEEARRLAAGLEEPDMVALTVLIDGPWTKRFPRAHEALTLRSPGGHYSVVSDAGVSHDDLDRLEATLAKAPAAKRPALLERFRAGLASLRELARISDCAYKAYSKLFKVGKDEERVTRVFLFDGKDEFARFSEKLGVGSMEHALGYFLPTFKVLVFYRAAPRGDELFTADLQDTFFHEAFHQFLDLYVADAPTWFNEGLAEYFGISELTREGLRYGLVPPGPLTRYTNLRDIVTQRQLPDLKSLLALDHPAFMVDAGRNYAVSWGLCHLLGSTKEGRKRLRDYWKGLRAGVAPGDLAEKVFGDLSEAVLEDALVTHTGAMARTKGFPDDAGD
jgi:hypothetical protein